MNEGVNFTEFSIQLTRNRRTSAGAGALRFGEAGCDGHRDDPAGIVYSGLDAIEF